MLKRIISRLPHKLSPDHHSLNIYFHPIMPIRFHRTRFRRDFSSESSFDGTAKPPWLMLAATNGVTSGIDIVNLDNAAGLVVKSRNENIAEFSEPQGSTNNDSRELMITGKSPGVTLIDVFAPGSNTAVLTKLEVSVKNQIVHTIAFHLVTDSLVIKSTRSSTSLTILHNVLNDIFWKRANVRFNLTRSDSIEASTNLMNIVIEQERHSSHAPRREWDKLVAGGDPDAEINVFFMPWEASVAKRPTEMLVYDGDIVCADSMSDDDLRVAFPHVIGSFLGCPVDYNDRHKDYLMYESHAEATDGGSFMPKDCINMINPD
jgi:hypothetical protein